MCLPNFIEFKQIDINKPLIGYRIWKNPIKDSLELKSEFQDYTWKSIEGPHKVEKINSGIYAYDYYNNNYNYYNNSNNYYYNYYNNNNNYYYYNNNNYNYYYSIYGIILQYGKTAIHKEGYRSEYAKIKTLFTIRENDAKGPEEFLNWIKIFNQRVEEIAKVYNCETISYLDFLDSNVK